MCGPAPNDGSKLERKVVHKCVPPEVEDVTAEYRWTCGECGSQWRYAWGTAYDRTVMTGMLWWRKSHTEHVVDPGSWYRETQPFSWEPA